MALSAPEYFVGLMSGTSLDGVDAVLIKWEEHPKLIKAVYHPFSDALRQELLLLNQQGKDELHRSASASKLLAEIYADAVKSVSSDTPGIAIRAIGCHGQTVRHRPDLGYTVQLNNPALLAELTGFSVVADFRSRDIAAGGQGAPLVPAFHQAFFSHADIARAIINIGGISNITYLPQQTVLGFDCGPGNLLMDGWIRRHLGADYDKGGNWAATGQIIEPMLQRLLSHPFFAGPPPKSTGRDDFHMTWLEQYLDTGYAPQDVQRTLLELTAVSISNALKSFYEQTKEIYICGGGAHNALLIERMQVHNPTIPVKLTDSLGVDADWVEASAFAWLARQTIYNRPGNLPTVTGAKHPCVLGAIYPA